MGGTAGIQGRGHTCDSYPSFRLPSLPNAPKLLQKLFLRFTATNHSKPHPPCLLGQHSSTQRHKASQTSSGERERGAQRAQASSGKWRNHWCATGEAQYSTAQYSTEQSVQHSHLIFFGMVTLTLKKWSPRIAQLPSFGTPFFGITSVSPGWLPAGTRSSAGPSTVVT